MFLITLPIPGGCSWPCCLPSSSSRVIGGTWRTRSRRWVRTAARGSRQSLEHPEIWVQAYLAIFSYYSFCISTPNTKPFQVSLVQYVRTTNASVPDPFRSITFRLPEQGTIIICYIICYGSGSFHFLTLLLYATNFIFAKLSPWIIMHRSVEPKGTVTIGRSWYKDVSAPAPGQTKVENKNHS